MEFSKRLSKTENQAMEGRSGIMEGKKVVYFKLLGSFSYMDSEEETGDQEISALNVGKKTLSFLQYLLVNHGRNISEEELIEQFWIGNSSDPANVLRVTLFKVRRLLKKMLPQYENVLLTFPGYYTWNSEFSLQLDTEEFERICLTAKRAVEEERCELSLRGIALYKGDFLSANDSEWAMLLRQYYRTLYLDLCKGALSLLSREERWMEIVSICEQAYQTDFTVEDFTVYRMQALIALGQPEQAIEKYQIFRDKMLRELEMPPTERVEQLYILAAGLGKEDVGVQEILDLVCEEEPDQRAFFCTFEIFQSIVALERRHCARSQQPSSLVIVSLDQEGAPAADARRLERVLLDSLRAGDPVARLGAGSYILMLTGASLENARLVMNRIDYTFCRTYRRSKASLSYRLAALHS